MLLETERLLLADYQFENFDDFFKLKSCNEVWKYLSFDPLIEKDQAEILLENLIDERIKGNYVFSALYKKNSKDFIGEAGIIGYVTHANRCMIGYNLLSQYWNHGYATEITKHLVKHSFEFLGIERIEALVLQINTASCRVLEKSGFLLEGVLRNGGQIGYGIRPTERKKGYGKQQLLLVLEIAKDMKIPKVMIICDKDNVASSQTAISCGGILTGVNFYEGIEQQIFWINLS